MVSGKAGMTEGRGTMIERWTDLPAGRIPMCCWPSSTKLPIGWPSGLYAAPWLTEGSRRKPDCSQNVDMKKGGGRRRENTPDNQQLSQLEPKHTVRHCAHVCGLTVAWHANTHTVGPHACKHTHTQSVSFKSRCIVLQPREENMQFDRMRRITARQFTQSVLKSVNIYTPLRAAKLKVAKSFNILNDSPNFLSW